MPRYCFLWAQWVDTYGLSAAGAEIRGDVGEVGDEGVVGGVFLGAGRWNWG